MKLFKSKNKKETKLSRLDYFKSFITEELESELKSMYGDNVDYSLISISEIKNYIVELYINNVYKQFKYDENYKLKDIKNFES